MGDSNRTHRLGEQYPHPSSPSAVLKVAKATGPVRQPSPAAAAMLVLALVPAVLSLPPAGRKVVVTPSLSSPIWWWSLLTMLSVPLLLCLLNSTLVRTRQTRSLYRTGRVRQLPMRPKMPSTTTNSLVCLVNRRVREHKETQDRETGVKGPVCSFPTRNATHQGAEAHRDLFSRRSGSQMSEIKGPAGPCSLDSL